MSAPVVDLADAIKDLLNTPSAFTPPLGADRKYEPYYELPELATAKVTVIPTSDKTIERIDRETWKHELLIEVTVQKKLSTDAESDKDAMVAQADAICEYVKVNMPERAEKLIDAGVASLIQNPLMRQNKLFTSGVLLKFVSFR